MKTNKQVLALALKHVGQGGSRFRKFCGLPSGAAWCNAYVDYVANEGDVESLYFNGKKETYCPHSMEWCKKNLAQIPPYLAMASDIIYFDWEKNGVPNHIGLVREKKSTSTIYTVEGNTDGGKVAKKTRNTKYVQAIFRPHYKGTVKICALETETGDFGYVSIANLRRALGMEPSTVLDKTTVKALQKKAGTTADGAWGPNTSKAVQKLIGVSQDGDFGKKSVIALKKWINKQNNAEVKPVEPKPEEKPKTTNADKMVAATKKLAWPNGTPKKKWSAATGKPTAYCKKIMNKLGWKKGADYRDCGNNVTCSYYVAFGKRVRFLPVNKKAAFPPPPDNMKICHTGDMKNFKPEPGMIGRWKKESGAQHIVEFMGNGLIAEGGRNSRYFVIHSCKIKEGKNTINKWESKKIKKDTIQVLCFKEQ